MTVKLNGVEVLCDGECGHRPGQCRYRCSATTKAALGLDGRPHVELPHGWTQREGQVFGPNCTDQMALAKALRAPMPSPEDDPPILAKGRDKRLEVMREVVKEDLFEDAESTEGLIALSGERAALDEMREIVEQGSSPDEPDFAGSPSASDAKIEVRVKGDYVEISWPDRPGLSLTLRHEGFQLLDPPAFVDENLLKWVQGCLATKRGEVSRHANPRVN